MDSSNIILAVLGLLFGVLSSKWLLNSYLPKRKAKKEKQQKENDEALAIIDKAIEDLKNQRIVPVRREKDLSNKQKADKWNEHLNE